MGQILSVPLALTQRGAKLFFPMAKTLFGQRRPWPNSLYHVLYLINNKHISKIKYSISKVAIEHGLEPRMFSFFLTQFLCQAICTQRNPEGTQVIAGSMNMGYISDTARNRTHNLFRPKREPIPLGHSDGLFQMFALNTHQNEWFQSRFF